MENEEETKRTTEKPVEIKPDPELYSPIYNMEVVSPKNSKKREQ